MSRPTILVTCDFELRSAPPPRPRSLLNADYSDAIYEAGGLPWPVALPPAADDALIDELLSRCRGVLLTGGDDLHAGHFGQAQHPACEVLHERRDRFEMALSRRLRAASHPVLAICLGCQVTNVVHGGSLLQHLDDVARTVAVQHRGAGGGDAFHAIRVEPGSRLAKIMGGTHFEVNSRHHQALDVARAAGALRPVAFAPDGVIEAVEAPGPRFVVGVQWHPENIRDRAEQARLFRALVEAAGG
ncbi:MAG TPA: gamma-glutamyl-gamma-aminobutyrate hydrolase family protein [Phycisphaerae bacterium]|nr:gamma-glutamyl-gamma-aminobutyrate hydrolase family protein [Phycisphaerae bacterium]